MAVTIMDGGMGGEIQARLEGAGHGLWSAKALVEAPQIVVDLHKQYIAAGAEIILTNSYSTIPHYLGKEGLAEQFVEYTKLAGQLARQAVRESDRTVQVAGSIPPLNESYRSDLVPSAEEALPVYRSMVEALQPYVDCYICETMSSADEALNAAGQAVAHGGGKPVYVSWTLNERPGKGLRSGEPIAEAYGRVSHLGLAGFMFNCTSPEAIIAAIPQLREFTDKPIGCYANRMNEVSPEWTLDNEISTGRRADLGTEHFVKMAEDCVASGATIVGGCCGIGPQDIAALHEALGAV